MLCLLQCEICSSCFYVTSSGVLCFFFFVLLFSFIFTCFFILYLLHVSGDKFGTMWHIHTLYLYFIVLGFVSWYRLLYTMVPYHNTCYLFGKFNQIWPLTINWSRKNLEQLCLVASQFFSSPCLVKLCKMKERSSLVTMHKCSRLYLL